MCMPASNRRFSIDLSVALFQVRNPYVDPLSVLQAEVLRRLRTDDFETQDEQALLQDALVITINGIANGQKNSG